MIIEVAGVQYAGFLKASVTLLLDCLSSTFKFTSTAEDAAPLPFRGNEACKIYVDGELVLTGYIEVVDASGGEGEHNIELSGRDKTCDIVDSTIGALSDIRAPITLKRVIEQIISHLGANVSVVDNVNPAPFNEANDLTAPEIGQGAFDFIESWARKRQVLLSSDGNGNIVITRSSGTVVDATLYHKNADDNNNVLSYAIGYNMSKMFRTYQFSCQQNPLTVMKTGPSNESIVDQLGVVSDSSIRGGRNFVMLSENAGSAADQKERVTWEMNVRRARSRVYSATVPGFRNVTGALWIPNTIVKVEDDFAGINSNMLINSVEYTIDNVNGRRTNLTCVNKDAFTLSIAEPVAEETGIGFLD
jgi:prophage tail gpP-like protein